MTTAVGCLGHLGAIAALAYALDQLTGASVAAAARPWAAVASATLIVVGLSNFLQLLRGYGQGDTSRSALLARATTGQPPAEGGPMVVTGVARPESGVALVSPVTAASCVAYDYRIYNRTWGSSSSGRRTTVYWWGLATQPFVVDTGARAVPVLAIPDIVDAAHELPAGDDVRMRLREYVQRTAFEQVADMAVIGAGVAMLGLIRAPHPAGVRHDWHRTGESPDPGTLLVDEGVVPVGETISVFGHWSPEHGAIIPEPGGLSGGQIAIARGGAEQLASRPSGLPSSAMSVAVFGVLMLGAGLGLAWAMQNGHLQALPLLR